MAPLLSVFLLLIVCLIQSNQIEAFQGSSFNRFAFGKFLKMSSHADKPEIIRGKKWPGNRPPINNPMLDELKMDASWGRGKFRDEIWEDNLCPKNEWWRAYEPTDEEYEAMALGYDFSNPRKWHEERGIDYDAALLETQKQNKLAIQKYQEMRTELLKILKDTPQKYDELMKKRDSILASHNKSDNIEDYNDEETEFLEFCYEMKCLREELDYRRLDDERQQKKGEISLDKEDSCVQFHNKN